MVKSIPVTSWSSPKPLNFRPRLMTLFLLSGGLFLFGLGETLLISAGMGVSPWTVLAQGVANHTGTSIGVTTFVISIFVLLAWIPLRQRPGMGTVLNAIIVAATIEFMLPLLPVPPSLELQIIGVIIGILLTGLGSGIYLVANLGAGPRDGLMTGLQRVTQLPIAWVRIGIELSVVSCGWALGGVVGVGTVMFALGIGPAVSAGLFFTARMAGVKEDNPV